MGSPVGRRRLRVRGTVGHNPGVRRAAVRSSTARPATWSRRRTTCRPDLCARCACHPCPATADSAVDRAVRGSRLAVWQLLTGQRRDHDLPDLVGETLVLDGSAERGAILVAQAEAGVQRLLSIEETGEASVVLDPERQLRRPRRRLRLALLEDAFLGADGDPVVVTSSSTTRSTPCGSGRRQVATSSRRRRSSGPRSSPWSPRVPTAPRCSSGGRCPGQQRDTIVEVHGGPNLVTVDTYRPDSRPGSTRASRSRRSTTAARSRSAGPTARASGAGPATASSPTSTPRSGGAGARPRRPGHDVHHRAVLRRPPQPAVRRPAPRPVRGRADDGGDGGLAGISTGESCPRSARHSTAPCPCNTTAPSTPPGSRTCSPASRRMRCVDDIRASVWLHGGRDARTPPAQAPGYVDRLRTAGGDVLADSFDTGHEQLGIEGLEQEYRRSLRLESRRRSQDESSRTRFHRSTRITHCR